MLQAAGLQVCDVPPTYRDNLPELAAGAARVLQHPALRWSHPVMGHPWAELLGHCTAAMLVDFLGRAGPTPMVCSSFLTWMKPLGGSISLQGDRVCLQYDDIQPFAPDTDRYMCSCLWCSSCDMVEITPYQFMGCTNCDTEYQPMQSPRSRCICHNRYFYEVDFVLEDIHSGELRIPQLLRYMQRYTPPAAAAALVMTEEESREMARQRACARIRFGSGKGVVSKAKLRYKKE